MAALKGHAFGYTENPFQYAYVAACNGDEKRLDECYYAGIENCNSEESGGVICEGTCTQADIYQNYIVT